MAKPILAILTDSIRVDNHLPLKYFKEIEIKHFYRNAPYGDLKEGDLENAVKWNDFKDLEVKLLELKPDMIQGAEPYASKTALRICLLTMKVAKQLNVPYIFPMFENRPVNKRFDPVTGIIVKKILKKYAQNASLIFYLNEGAKKNLLQVGANPSKMKKELYGVWGVDSEIFRPDYPKPSALNAVPYILFVGRLDEAKGIPYLLAAWNSIKGKFPKIELVFIGSGELEKEVKGTQIIRLGQMKNTDLPPYFANALFSVYPSITQKRWEEQVGTVNLQSLSCGTPIVTTSSGAIPEYVNDKVAVIVPEQDANALANAMENLVKNSNFRQKLAENTRPYILENFDAQKNIGKIEKILLNLGKLSPIR